MVSPPDRPEFMIAGRRWRLRPAGWGRTGEDFCAAVVEHELVVRPAGGGWAADPGGRPAGRDRRCYRSVHSAVPRSGWPPSTRSRPRRCGRLDWAPGPSRPGAGRTGRPGHPDHPVAARAPVLRGLPQRDGRCRWTSSGAGARSAVTRSTSRPSRWPDRDLAADRGPGTRRCCWPGTRTAVDGAVGPGRRVRGSGRDVRAGGSPGGRRGGRAGRHRPGLLRQRGLGAERAGRAAGRVHRPVRRPGRRTGCGRRRTGRSRASSRSTRCPRACRQPT